MVLLNFVGHHFPLGIQLIKNDATIKLVLRVGCAVNIYESVLRLLLSIGFFQKHFAGELELAAVVFSDQFHLQAISFAKFFLYGA